MPAEEPKSDAILLFIALYKLATAALFLAASIGVLHFLNRDVEEWLLHLMNHIRVDDHNRIARSLLKEAGMLSNSKIESISAIAFCYACLFTTEGLGLLFRKRWAEYLVVIVTGSLLPLEIYELCEKVNLIKVTLFMGNLAIVGYLISVLWKGRNHKA